MKKNTNAMLYAAIGVGVGGVIFSCVGDSTTNEPDAGTDASITPDVSSDVTIKTDASDAAVIDGGADVDAADGSIPFTPAQLTGLVLWLDAAKVIKDGASKVITWPDSSDAGNNATTFDGGQPLLFPTALNGLPVVQFDGNVQSVGIADSTSLQFGVSDYAVVAVAAYSNTPSNNPTFGFGTIYAKNETVGPYKGPSVIGNDPYNLTSQLYVAVAQDVGVRSTDAGYNNNIAHIFGCRRHGSTLDAIADQTIASGTPTLTDVSAVGHSAYVGGVPPYYQALNGYVAELVAVKGTLADADLAKLLAYYKSKYGL